MCHMCFGESQTRRTNKSLILWRLPCETRSHKCDLCDHPLPLLCFSFSGSNHAKHFILCNGPHLGKGNLPFTSFLFSFLLNCVAKDLSTSCCFTIQQVCRHRSFLDIVVNFAPVCLFFMHSKRFLHQCFLCITLLCKQLTFDAQCLLGKGGSFVHFTSLFLALLLKMIQAVPMPLPMQLNVVSLRHVDGSN
eukprot:Gb_20607 [translate_table: standard]